MKRLKAQLRLHFGSCKILILLMIGLIAFSVIMDIFLLTGKNHPGSFFSIYSNTILTYLLAFSVCSRYNFQYIIGMGATRRDYLKGVLIFQVLASLVTALLIVTGFVVENILFKLYGRMQLIDFFGVIKFHEMNAAGVMTLLVLYFSIVFCVMGFGTFMVNIITSYINGISVYFVITTVFMVILFSLIFGRLNNLVLNLFVEDLGMVLYLKLIIVGLCGVLLSWPFVKTMENFELNWGRKKY